eukprot:UN30308
MKISSPRGPKSDLHAFTNHSSNMNNALPRKRRKLDVHSVCLSALQDIKEYQTRLVNSMETAGDATEIGTKKLRKFWKNIVTITKHKQSDLKSVRE